MQTEVTTLSPQVGFYDHRRALLTAENVLLKQKLATLTQTQRYKEGGYYCFLLTTCMKNAIVVPLIRKEGLEISGFETMKLQRSYIEVVSAEADSESM